MKVIIDITVDKWYPWMKHFNRAFARANRTIEIWILDKAFRKYFN